MVLMIDNYDSFTYNLVQYFMQLGEEVKVFRNDKITVEQAEQIEFDYLVISPGPGGPQDSGVSAEMIKRFAGKKPILGVCLGHQTIGWVFGGKIINATRIMHGKSDMITHDGTSIFAGLPDPLRVIRYHSLAIDRDSLSDEFEVSAESSDGQIMAIRHKSMRIEGVQFHPESIGSEAGMKILSNFLSGIRELPPVKSMLKKLVNGGTLSEEEAGHLIAQVTDGGVAPAQIGSFLTALAIRGVSTDELAGFASVLHSKAVPVPLEESMELTDTCGTGGDGSGTFNISTAAAFVACGAGVNIAKHGNRSITSRSGSADVLEALGIKIDMTPKQAAACLKENGICFLFAPHYHPAFKNIMGPRRELGFRTVFNMMGPMLNPARVSYQVMGVFSPDLTEQIAEVLGRLGLKRALVVHGDGGMDEFSLSGPTKVTELKDGWIKTRDIDPAEFGFEYCSIDDLKGGSAEDNAEIIRSILGGEMGPRRDVVVLNAAASILASNMANDFPEAVSKAQHAIDSGAAMDKLRRFVDFSRTVESS